MTLSRRLPIVLVVLLGGIAHLPGSLADSVPEQDRAGAPVDSTAVYSRALLVTAEIELIRVEMGKPRNPQKGIRVRNAAPREVFFQSLTLFDKANRLCFELTRERAVAPITPTADIQSSHVLEVVDAALDCIRKVKAHLGIDDAARPSRPTPDKTPRDVFHAIVDNNRQLNLLLERQFAPSDVYEKLTLAVSYASRILQQSSASTTRATIPEAPSFERGKRPVDVYRRLLSCFEQVREIAKVLQLETLELDVSQTDWEAVTPSEVYDIASLLVSELAYLHSRYPGAKPPRQVYYPGRKLPSHVYQRAGLLEKQLASLLEQVGAEREDDGPASQ